MKKAIRLLAILFVLLAASAVPSPAIIPNCDEWCNSEFFTCESPCDCGCWDKATSSGTNCVDWCSGLSG